MKRIPASRKFRDYLLKSLKKPALAAEYINAAMQEKEVDFLLTALRDVAEAQGGMTALSRKSRLNRANLYEMLSGRGDPRMHTLESVLRVFGLRLAVMPATHLHRAA